MTRYKFFAAQVVMLSAVVACSNIEYQEVEISSADDAPADTIIDEELIRIPVGVAQEIEAEIEFKDGRYYFGDYFHLEARDNDILGVAPMSGDDTYLIWGVHEGETCLEINVAGTVEECIDVEVIASADGDTDVDGDTDTDADSDADTDTGDDTVTEPPPGCDDILVFSDADLEAAVRDEVEIPTWDLYFDDVMTVTTLSARNSGISDLTGIHCLANLEGLDLDYNTIRDLTPLADLTRLSSLLISGNDIGDLSPLANLTRLEELRLSGNAISDLSPLTDLSGLVILDLNSNDVSDLSPLSSLTELSILALSSNTVGDLAPLSDLTNLTELSLQDNLISDIAPVADLDELSSLTLSNNDISDIAPLVDNTGIDSEDTVDLSFNPLDCGDAATQGHIATLESRGVILTHDCN